MTFNISSGGLAITPAILTLVGRRFGTSNYTDNLVAAVNKEKVIAAELNFLYQPIGANATFTVDVGPTTVVDFGNSAGANDRGYGNVRVIYDKATNFANVYLNTWKSVNAGAAWTFGPVAATRFERVDVSANADIDINIHAPVAIALNYDLTVHSIFGA